MFLEGRYYLKLLFYIRNECPPTPTILYVRSLQDIIVLFRSDVEGGVSIRVTTSNIRVKRTSDKEVMFEFPLFRVSYCGTDRRQKEVFSFVAKETDGR